MYYFSDDNLKGAVDKEFGQVVTWDTPLLEGYSYHFIKNHSPKPGLTNRFFGLINPGLLGCLRREPSKIIIVNGWGYFSTVAAIIAGRLMGKSVWVRGENPLSQELKKPRPLLLAKNILLKHFLFRFINRFLYIGKESRSFYEFYGARPEQLVYTPYAVDNDFFDRKYLELKDDKIHCLRL